MAHHDVKTRLCQGLLHKRGKLNKGWKERYFILTDDLKLKYYESQSKLSESEMLGNDDNVFGIINILNVELIEIALIDINNDKDSIQIPKYVKLLKNYKKTSANYNGKNNENGSIDNIRSNIIHLVLSSRTYILSANTKKDFNKWLSIFYKYIYDGVIFQSFGYKQGQKNKAFKKRYFVLNKYNQIKYYDNEYRNNHFGFIDLNDIHSFNTNNINVENAPNNNYLIELNGSKRIWILCFETSQILTEWCRIFVQKLKLKVARKVGDSFYKQDTNYLIQINDEKNDDDNDNNDDNDDNDNDKNKNDDIKEIENEGLKESGNNENEYKIQFKIIVDGIGLYKDQDLENEVFGILDGFEKGTFIFGKYVMDKIVQLSNDLYCSSMAVQEIGRKLTVIGGSTGGGGGDDGDGDHPSIDKLPSYFNI